MNPHQEPQSPTGEEEVHFPRAFNLSNKRSSRGGPIQRHSELAPYTGSYKSNGDSFILPFRPHPHALPRAKVTLVRVNKFAAYNSEDRRLPGGSLQCESLPKRSIQAGIISQKFSGSIIIEKDETAAISYAKLEYDEQSSINNKPRAVFWTNAYCNTKGLGAGIAYKTRKNNFAWRQYHITTSAALPVAKGIAVGQALENAWKICTSMDDKPSTVVVYTDSAPALKAILSPESKKVADRIIGCSIFSRRLKQLGVHVELRWVPTSSISELPGVRQSRAASMVKHKYQRCRTEPLRPVVEAKDLNMRHELKKGGVYMARSAEKELFSPSGGDSPASEGSAGYFTDSTASTLHILMDRMEIDG